MLRFLPVLSIGLWVCSCSGDDFTAANEAGSGASSGSGGQDAGTGGQSGSAGQPAGGAAGSSGQAGSGAGGASGSGGSSGTGGVDDAGSDAATSVCANPPCKLGEPCVKSADCKQAACVAKVCSAVRNCNSLPEDAKSGRYFVDIDGPGPRKVMLAQCDESQGGGWMLVLNYVHKAATNPQLNNMFSRLPLKKSSTLGVDESSDPESWGHVVPSLMKDIQFSETRWFARTSAHSRVIHFKNNAKVVNDYIKDGSLAKGAGCDPKASTNSSTNLSTSGGSAKLPQNATDGFCARGDKAMTEYPFFKDSTYHWGVRGTGTRWEVDDYLPTSPDTLHRVWVR